MKLKRLVNPYSEEVYLVMNLSELGLKKFVFGIQPNYKNWVLAVAAGRMEDPVDSQGVQCFYIWIDQSVKSNDIRLYVIHETAHLTFALLKNAGVPISIENDEAFTYLQEDLCKQAFRVLKL